MRESRGSERGRKVGDGDGGVAGERIWGGVGWGAASPGALAQLATAGGSTARCEHGRENVTGSSLGPCTVFWVFLHFFYFVFFCF